MATAFLISTKNAISQYSVLLFQKTNFSSKFLFNSLKNGRRGILWGRKYPQSRSEKITRDPEV